ncbi:MAG: hypothetical protein EA352_02800 [Gemmatimonadales bacterium]|nr:MAG: hypothetical protein EA352_02800 [Gemmatimonadales bacterium]
MTQHASPHPQGDALQAFAGRELPPEAARQVERHLVECARCRSEVEGWTLLFGQLEELPELTPSAAFRDRVMAGVPSAAPAPGTAPETAEDAPPGLFTRLLRQLRSWLPHAGGRAGAPDSEGPVRPDPSGRAPPRGGGHPGTDRIQGLLEGSLSPAILHRVEAHLDTCPDCRDVAGEWRPLMARLDQLGHLPAPAGFRSAVMARVDVQAVAERARRRSLSPLRRTLELAGRLRPRSSRGWLVAGGLGALPTAATAAAVVAITAHPLLSLGGIVTLARWRLTEWVLGSGEAALGHLASLGGGIAITAVQAVAQAPGPLAASMVVLAAGTAASAWVLLRVLPIPSLIASRHEHRPS